MTAAQSDIPKLTPAQWATLREVARNKPQRVVASYQPAHKLAALGLVTLTIVERPYPLVVEITDAGREVLRRATERDERKMT